MPYILFFIYLKKRPLNVRFSILKWPELQFDEDHKSFIILDFVFGAPVTVMIDLRFSIIFIAILEFLKNG